MRRDAAFNRRVMRVFEDMLEQPEDDHVSWLERVCGHDPATREAVRAMFEASRLSRLLPTAPPDGREAAAFERRPDRIGRYRVIAELGRGGMGIVYLGERDDGLFEHKVAIKLMRQTLLSERARNRFATERRILARLRHPHIAQIHDGGVTPDGDPYIVMEAIAGEPITDYCSSRSLDLKTRLALFHEAADAIDHAHRNLIVHADIKPSNVVVEDRFGVKLLDFGIARLLDEADGEGDRHRSHTPGYASHARFEGEPATPADDVFAAGTLLGELIGGLGDVDADLEAIVAKASAPAPESRYGTIRDLLEDLDRWQERRPVRAVHATRRRRARLFCRRNRLWLGIAIPLALALLIGLGVITALWLRSERQRALANERYAATRHMADYIIGDIDPALARVSGTLALRKRLLERTDRYLKGLAADRLSSPALKRDIAAGYLRMAKIYGLDPSGGIGDIATAEANLAHAERLIDEAAEAEPDAPELLALRGQARMLAGSKIFPAPSRATAEASIAELRQAQNFFRRYLALRHEDVGAQLSLWEAEMIQERAYLYLGKPLTGVAAFEKELAKASIPVRTRTEREERDFILNASYLVLGESYQTSDIGRSERYFSLLIGNLERLRRRGGLDWESSLTQASGYIGRGRLEAKLTDLATAAADYARAISIMQDLLLTDDNHGVKWELSYVRSLLAVVDSRLGDHAAAASLSDSSMAWLQRDLADAPHDPARRRALAVGLSTRADIERRTHRGAKACIVARRAVAMWTELNAARVTPPMDLKPDGAETQALAVVASSCR